MNKKYKVLTLTALFTMSGVVLAGCGQSNDANTLNVVCLNRGYGPEWIADAVSIWEEQNPGCKVNLNLTASAQSIFEGNIKKPNNTDDVYISLGTQWKEVSSYLLEIDDLIEEEVDGVKIKDKVSKEYRDSLYLTNTSGEKHAYRLPWTSGVGGILYNEYLFDLYGWNVPTTYQELVDLCRQIIADEKPVPGSRSDTVYPFVYTGNNTDYFDYAVFTWWSQIVGTEKIKEFKNYTRESKENFDVSKNETYNGLKKATEMWYDLFGKYDRSSPAEDPQQNEFYNKIAAPTDLQADNHSAQKKFMKGHAAMMFNGDWCYNEMIKYSGELPETFKPRFMKTPSATGAVAENLSSSYIIGEDQYMVIPKTTIKPELAKSFLKVLASDQMIKIFSEKAHGFLGFDLSTGDFDVSSFSDEYMKTVVTYKNEKKDTFTNFSLSPLFLNNKVDFWVGKRPFLECINGTENVDSAFNTILDTVNSNWETWCQACNI